MAKKHKTYPLGYAVINGQVAHNTGTARPATSQEMDLWRRLVALDPSIAVAEDADVEAE